MVWTKFLSLGLRFGGLEAFVTAYLFGVLYSPMARSGGLGRLSFPGLRFGGGEVTPKVSFHISGTAMTKACSVYKPVAAVPQKV